MIVSVKRNTLSVLFVSLHAFCQFSIIPECKAAVARREKVEYADILSSLESSLVLQVKEEY